MYRPGRTLLCTIVAALWLVAAGACSSRDVPEIGPGEIGDCSSFVITTDSADLRHGVTVKALNDSTLQFRSPGSSRRLQLPEPLEGRFRYSSEQPIVDALYRLEASTALSPDYYSALPYEACLDPLQADSLTAALFTHEANGFLVPTDTRRYSWPVVNDNPQWLMAAAELCTVSGDIRAYKRVRHVAANLASTDASVAWNSTVGLFQGVPRYMAEAALPAWMSPTDIFGIMTLGGNVSRYAAARTMRALDSFYALDKIDYLPVSPDSLRRNINTLLWMPNMGRYSALLYGMPVCPVQLKSSDNLAQAITVITGTALDLMGNTLIKRTPVPQTGIDLFVPRWSGAGLPGSAAQLPRHALWAVACARIGNETAYSAAVGALIYNRCRELAQRMARKPEAGKPLPFPRFTGRPVTSLIVRGLLGMRFDPRGIKFTPFVPETMPGEKHITGLRYRKAILNIVLRGTGRAVSTFTLDSVPTQPMISADLEGTHEITITLAGASANPGIANILEGESPVIPVAPEVKWTTTHHAVLRTPSPRITENTDSTETESVSATGGNDPESAGTTGTLVYLNGTLIQEINRRDYTLYNAPHFTVVQFCPVSSSEAVGFSGQPYLYVPPGQNRLIFAADVSKAGSRLIEDLKVAARYVELNRYRNRTIEFTVDAASEGTYIIDVNYINGLGIVNPQRRAVIRDLLVDGVKSGTLIFPQLSSAWWRNDPETHWHDMTGYTNPLPVKLKKGSNTIAIRYRQPSPVYLNPLNNTVLINSIRVIPLEGGDK